MQPLLRHLNPLMCLGALTAAALAGDSSSATQPATRRASNVILQDSFANLDNWVCEGPFGPDVAQGRMHIRTVYEPRHVGQYVWCRKALPADFRVEFDLTPASDSGYFLLFFCTQGVHGEDILGDDLLNHYLPARSWMPDEDFDKYVSADNRAAHHQFRIRGYHVSYRRGSEANCNLRKNPHMTLLKSAQLESLLAKDKTAHVSLTKKHGHVLLQVNGAVFMDYADEKGPYSFGRFGFRQVYDAEGYYAHFKLFDLTGSPG